MATGDGLYKRPDSKFWWACYTPPKGRPVRKSTRTTNKQAASALLARWVAEAWSADTGIVHPLAGPPKPEPEPEPEPEPPPALTVEEVREIWISEHKGKTRRSGDSRWQHLIPFLGGPLRPAHEITAGELEEVRVKLLKHYAEGTVSLFVADMRSGFAAAVRRGHLPFSPAAHLRNPRVHNERTRICTEEEERLLLGRANPRVGRAIMIALDTGLRRSEVASLTWDKIDLKQRVITLLGSDAKNRRVWRVPLTKRLVEELEPLDRAQPPVPLTSTSIYDGFSRVCKRVGIKGLRFHDLRHTAATRMRRAGVDWWTVMRILNHKSVEAARRYQTIDDADLQGAATQLERYLNDQSKG